MAAVPIPFKGTGNTTVTYDAIAMGGLKSAGISMTQDTWDGTASDVSDNSRVMFGTYSTGTATLGGIYDLDDVGQVKAAATSQDATTAALVITFRTGDTMTVQAIMTAYDQEGDDEGGWTWTASFQFSGIAVWASV